MLPLGIFRDHSLIDWAICWKDRLYFLSELSRMLILISFSRSATMDVNVTSGRSSISSLMSSVNLLRELSSISPCTATEITGFAPAISRQTGFSTFSGKVSIASTSAFILSSISLGSSPDMISMLTLPTFSDAFDVIFFTPSKPCKRSSIFIQIASSTSDGVAPGYTTETLIMFRSISGNTSIFNIGIVVAPVTMINTIIRFDTTLLLTNQRINFSMSVS